ncbi:hypothetical protein NEHOM01_1812 [Nematocida homosporus]|uniref:uncharacterized protein n=1 Tax=Nematocida homosporus TaxID=1912981 RepID=UPI0022210CAB|nr:uncharacterized protein NEHOM01_1812 [Nematocida homosporus]KAI5186946.1 hypothetical protein NEHOM01_1812 [Nematocida homosporus]
MNASDDVYPYLIESLLLSGGFDHSQPSSALLWKLCPMVAVNVDLERGDIAGCLAMLDSQVKRLGDSAYPDRKIMRLVCAYLALGKKKRAVDVLTQYVDERKGPNPELERMKVVLEGRVCYEQKSLTGCKLWVTSAFRWLERSFDFGIMMLLLRILQEFLMVPEAEALARVFAVVKVDSLEYLETAGQSRDLELLVKYLNGRGQKSVVATKVYLRRNPMAAKATIKAYMTDTKDVDTLQYILERRQVPELWSLARQMGIDYGLVQTKQKGFDWSSALSNLSKRLNTSAAHAASHLNYLTIEDLKQEYGISEDESDDI